MTLTVDRAMPNAMYSIFRYLRTTVYDIAGVEQTLLERFQALRVVPAYPDELTEIVAPTLALGGPDVMPGRPYFGGRDVGARDEDLLLVALYGFVLGRGSDAANRAYRDALMNDVTQLLAQHALDSGIPLYDAASEAALDGSLDLTRVQARQLPVNAPTIEVDRYKFLVTAEVSYD